MNGIHKLAVALLGCACMTISSASSPNCKLAARRFLSDPAKITMLALKANQSNQCWSAIKVSRSGIERLLGNVRMGNYWSANYLMINLGRLDGGQLEDAFVALGDFADKDMAGFLALARQMRLSDHDFSNALTMLPLSMSDDPLKQLSAMRLRMERVTSVSRSDLNSQKALALKVINDFIREIEKGVSISPSGSVNNAARDIVQATD